MKNSGWYCGWMTSLFAITLLSSCDIINPAETIPVTLHLEPFTFTVEAGEGSANNKISEVWVVANGSILGAFTPPVDIRYLGEGLTTFRFVPGIRNNGIANDAIPYQLFSDYTIELDVVPGNTYQIMPVTGYVEEAVFSFMADFETGNPFVDNKDTVSASNLVLSQEEVFEGAYSGKMSLSEEAHYIKVTHPIGMTDLPKSGKATYLEMRYKSAVEFSIGLIGLDVEGLEAEDFFYLVKPSEEWNQLYLELTDRVIDSDLDAYKIAFQALYLVQAGDTVQDIYLDNIKVVHR